MRIRPYFLRRIANIKEVLAKIRRLLALTTRTTAGLTSAIPFKTIAAAIKRQPMTTKNLDEFVICISFLLSSSFIKADELGFIQDMALHGFF